MSKKNDATQQGVPADDDILNAEDVVREPSARELAMEAIADIHVNRAMQDMEAPREESEHAKPVSAVDQQLTAQFDSDSPSFLQTKMRLKIDGVEREVTIDEMQRQYQKNGAAERRLEEATRLLNQARVGNPALGIDAAPKNADSSLANTTPQGDENKVDGKDFISALFDGDEDRALEALSRIGIGRSTSTQLDPGQLAAQLTPAIRQQFIVESALEQFAANYADIVADPYLADLADRFLDDEVKAGKPFQVAIEEAGKRTRDWLGSKGVKTTEPNPTIGRNTKLERKAGMDNFPTLNTKATTVDEPEQTATSVIEEMRKARGLTA